MNTLTIEDAKKKIVFIHRKGSPISSKSHFTRNDYKNIKA